MSTNNAWLSMVFIAAVCAVSMKEAIGVVMACAGGPITFVDSGYNGLGKHHDHRPVARIPDADGAPGAAYHPRDVRAVSGVVRDGTAGTDV